MTINSKTVMALAVLAIIVAAAAVLTALPHGDEAGPQDDGGDLLSVLQKKAYVEKASAGDDRVFLGYFIVGFYADEDGAPLMLFDEDCNLVEGDVYDCNMIPFVIDNTWVYPRDLEVIAMWSPSSHSPGEYVVTVVLGDARYTLTVVKGEPAPSMLEACRDADGGVEYISEGVPEGWYLTGATYKKEVAVDRGFEWQKFVDEDGNWAMEENLTIVATVDNAYTVVLWDNGVNIGQFEVRYGESFEVPGEYIPDGPIAGFYTSNGKEVASFDGSPVECYGIIDGDGRWVLAENLDLYVVDIGDAAEVGKVTAFDVYVLTRGANLFKGREFNKDVDQGDPDYTEDAVTYGDLVYGCCIVEVVDLVGSKASSFSGDYIDLPEYVVKIAGTDYYEEASEDVEGALKVLYVGGGEKPIAGKLVEAEMPDTAIEISASAFKGNSALEWITYNDSLEVIGDSAFEGCGLFMGDSIPDSTKYVGKNAFKDTIFADDEDIDGDSAYYIDKNGIWYNAVELDSDLAGTLAADPNGRLEVPAFIKADGNWPGQFDTLEVGDYVITSIGPGAFAGRNDIQQLMLNKMENSLLYIGDNAFSSCESLVYVKMPTTVKRIGENAFPEVDVFNEIEISSTSGNYVLDE